MLFQFSLIAFDRNICQKLNYTNMYLINQYQSTLYEKKNHKQIQPDDVTEIYTMYSSNQYSPVNLDRH